MCFIGDRVRYASGTAANLDAMVKAGLNGMTMPRRFGGLNFPITPYTMCAELVAASDAGFGNIWSLQDCIETLYEFGNEDQHSRFIPRICAGETMSMDLTGTIHQSHNVLNQTQTAFTTEFGFGVFVDQLAGGAAMNA